MLCPLFLISLPSYRDSVGFQMGGLENIHLLEADFQVLLVKMLNL